MKKNKKPIMASVGEDRKAGSVKPVSSNRQMTLTATKNFFEPDGTFVKEGTKIKVGSAKAVTLVNSGRWQVSY